MTAVVYVRTAEEQRIRSGIRSSSCNSVPISGAVRLPRLLRGRSWSASSGCFQLDLAWRNRSKVFIQSWGCEWSSGLWFYCKPAPPNTFITNETKFVKLRIFHPPPFLFCARTYIGWGQCRWFDEHKGKQNLYWIIRQFLLQTYDWLIIWQQYILEVIIRDLSPHMSTLNKLYTKYKDHWVSVSQDYSKVFASSKNLEDLVKEIKEKKFTKGMIIKVPSQKYSAYVGWWG